MNRQNALLYNIIISKLSVSSVLDMALLQTSHQHFRKLQTIHNGLFSE